MITITTTIIIIIKIIIIINFIIIKHAKSYHNRATTHASTQCKRNQGSGHITIICLLDNGPLCAEKGLLYEAPPI